MTITQTIDIPADSRKLTIDIPREIPAGPTIIAFTPAPAKTRPHISQYFGILSPDTYGDGVAYQRQLRDEWDE